jgi:hypothetical protein
MFAECIYSTTTRINATSRIYRYSGVQRSQNAYIPPGARRGLGQGPAAVEGVKTNGNLAQALRSSPAPATPATDAKAQDSTAKQSVSVSKSLSVSIPH